MKKIYVSLSSAIVICTLLAGCTAKLVEMTLTADMIELSNNSGLGVTTEQKTTHDDGSATYVLTKANHSKFIEGIANSIDTSIAEMVESEDFSEIFESIESNNNYTAITVTMHNPKINQFYMIGPSIVGSISLMYQQANNVENPSVKITQIDAATGEVVSEDII